MVTGPWLLAIFAFSIMFVLIVIIKFKLNPFIALLLTCIVTGLLVRMPLMKISESMSIGFGNTLKGIGIVIGLGIIFGKILAESGVTERIAQALVNRVGEKNSPLAIVITGYLVSIPVFFDAAFVILISLVKKLSKLARQPQITLVTALSIGLITSHNFLVPTPGPVEVANSLNVSMGIFFIYAFIVGIPAILIGGWLYGRFIGRKSEYQEEEDTLDNTADSSGRKPSSFYSFLILLLPIILILCGSIMSLTLEKGSALHSFFAFIGNKNNALLISVILAIVTLRKYVGQSMSQIVVEAADRGGLILLITGAGGAFGYLINTSGIGNYLVETMSAWNLSFLFTGFILAAVLRGALGSSTVALVTASSILGPVVLSSGASPILVALAVCAGGNCSSLPNDSGFWVVTRFSGLTIGESLKAWTLGATLTGVIAFIVVLLLSLFSDILPGL